MTNNNILNEINNNSVLSVEFGRVISIDLLFELINEKYKVLNKGTNPHPYADTLHSKIEDMTLVLETVQERAAFAGWVISTMFEYNKDKFRIREILPIYEYQWLVKVRQNDGSVIAFVYEFCTEEEHILFKSELENEYWLKIEETKRIRK